MKNKKQFYFIIILGILVLFGIIFVGKNDVQSIEPQKTSKKSNKKVYEHTFPERISKNDSFKGEFISNDIASIYPRRDAIIRDILVDIGDKVEVGETLAILFEPGVSGEANSKINVKNTLLSTKNNLLLDVEKVASAKLSEIDSKINEKQIILNETINNFDSKIIQLEKILNDNKISDEENIESSQSKKIDDSKNNIEQKTDLLNTKIEEVLYAIIPIIYIGNEGEIDYDEINGTDLADVFGARDTILTNNLIKDVKIFQNEISTLLINEKYEKLVGINNTLIKVLKNTIISINAPESQISSYIKTINLYNSELLAKKENYDDALKSYNILIESEIEDFENKKLELDSLQTNKLLQVEKLKAEIETLKSTKNLLNASENKNITVIENEIAIARSNLNKEYIASGNNKIISPFSGIISKRNIEIGEKHSSNIEAFRITNVETTLSKITKKEVKFYVPEILKQNLELGKEISFSVGDNENKSFTGIIYRMSPEVDEDNFSIIVQARVNENILLPNKSTLNVNLETKENIFKIPSSSIYNKEERKIVYYKKDNGKLGVRDISIISDDGEFSLITGEFDETLKIVTTPIFIK